MNKEEWVLILQALTEMKETRESKKLKDKISIFIERHNLDEDYQNNMEKLAKRLQELENPETINNDN